VNSPSVSIVIPTYFRSAELSELFDSLIKQTVSPFEVIIVDDTPTDVIKVVCEEDKYEFTLNGSELIYVRNPRERSSAIARNVGAKIARSDIIMFLDSDVVLYPDYIEKIIDVFTKYMNALGVQGWNINARKIKTHPILKAIQKFFYLQHYVKNSCKYTEYPYSLTKTINCEYLHGSNFAIKKKVLNEFEFDENLKKYSYMEDLLFSYSIYQKYSGSLFITPYAKCIHKTSEKGRMNVSEMRPHLYQCSKYVLNMLFGNKGSLILYLQTSGNAILSLIKKIWFLKKK
jgi:glycosyltransferase involved in cell wall biosynthesis